MALTATYLNCSLKPSPASSSTDALLGLFQGELAAAGVQPTGDTVRVVDQDAKPGTSHDEGAGDAWPDVEARIMDAQILVFGTPIWLGHPASTTQRVLERLDAFVSETDDRGQMP